MKLAIIVSVGVGRLALLSLSATGEGPHRQGHSSIKEGTLADDRQDERVALGLDRTAEAGMRLTMREHLEALRILWPLWAGRSLIRQPGWRTRTAAFPNITRPCNGRAGRRFLRSIMNSRWRIIRRPRTWPRRFHRKISTGSCRN